MGTNGQRRPGLCLSNRNRENKALTEIFGQRFSHKRLQYSLDIDWHRKKYLPLKHPKVKDAVQGYAANAKLYYTVQQLRQDPELATTLSTLFRRKQGRRLLKQMATWDDKKMQALRLMVG